MSIFCSKLINFSFEIYIFFIIINYKNIQKAIFIILAIHVLNLYSILLNLSIEYYICMVPPVGGYSWRPPLLTLTKALHIKLKPSNFVALHCVCDEILLYISLNVVYI